jgi:ribonuclease-3
MLPGYNQMDEETLLQLEQLLDYRFSNPSLLFEALAHSSQSDNRLASNERLEFLGDSVLALVICQTLFARFPAYLEGDLTKIKSRLVSRKNCAKIANRLGLAKFVKVGKGMFKTRAMSGSIAAGTFEAIIAAIYLDGGMEAATDFLLKMFGPLIQEADAKQHQENFKSFLQQYAQHEFNITPDYELLDEKGPDHNKCFETAVVMGLRRFPSAWGITKKDAEQKAAYNALVELGLLRPEEA